MSGGYLTDHEYDLCRLKNWAQKIEQENVILAEMLRDLYDLLGRYDYYMSGDINVEDVKKAWCRFRDKWIAFNRDEIEKIIKDKCQKIVTGAFDGCVGDGN